MRGAAKREGRPGQQAKVKVPWFIFLFPGASVISTYVPRFMEPVISVPDGAASISVRLWISALYVRSPCYTLDLLHGLARFPKTEIGDVKRLQGIAPSKLRLRLGNYRIRFYDQGETIQILAVKHRKRA